MRRLTCLIVVSLLAACGADAVSDGGTAGQPDTGNNTAVPETTQEHDNGPVEPPEVGLPPTQPVIYKVTPGTGPAAGGTLVVIEGAGYYPAARVRFGEQEAPLVKFLDPGHLVARAPAGLPGAADVTVLNPDGGSGVFANGFTYWQGGPEVAPPPALLEVVPNQGPAYGGTAAVIKGSGFQKGATILVDWRVVTTAKVTSESQASFLTPPMTQGTVDISITNPDGQSSSLPKAFGAYGTGTESLPGPTVSSIHPQAGTTDGGTAVTVKGDSLNAASIAILDGALVENWTVTPPDRATFTTPAHAPGLVALWITNPDGQSVLNPGAFLYFIDRPVVFGVEPEEGPTAGGNVVTVHGDHFQDGATVDFGGLPCTGATVIDEHTITCTAPPAAAADEVAVTVKNPDGLDGTLPGAYRYAQPPEGPALGMVIPQKGPTAGGILVFVQGAGILDGASVSFGLVPAQQVWVPGPNGVVAMLPPSLPGVVDVTVVNPDGKKATLAAAFTFEAEKPIAPTPKELGLDVVQPPTGPTSGGGWAVLGGHGFPKDLQVSFGGTPCAEVKVLSPSVATVRVPAGAAGAVNVTVSEANGGTATLESAYIYLVPAPGTAPTLGAIAPATGPVEGGTLARVSGTGFVTGALVFLDGIPATDVWTAGAALASLRTPAGGIGAADVAWVNPDGQWAELPGSFVYLGGTKSSVTVTGAWPVQGPIAGGTDVTVSGTGFVAGSLLFLDGLPVDAAVASTKAIEVTTPPHAAGSVDLSVTTPDGWTATLNNGFNYAVLPPVLYEAIPDHGPAAGGNTVTVLGAGFQAGAKAWIQGQACEGAIVASPNELSCKVPAGVSGSSAVIEIENTDGLIGALPGAYTYDTPAVGPALGTVSPAVGPTSGGPFILITGTGFTDGASVSFGGALSKSVHVASPTTVVAQLPAWIEGSVDVTLTNPDGKSSMLPQSFTFELAATTGGGANKLALALVQPPMGPTSGGGFVTLKGYDFSAGLTATFGENASTMVKVIDVTTAVARVPGGAEGPVDVTLTLPSGAKATLIGGYVYLAGAGTPPALTSVKPPIGPTVGGTLAVLSGSALQAGAYVYVDGLPAANMTLVSALTASFITPPGEAGPADITWVNPDGYFAELKGAFVFTPGGKPTTSVTSVVPVQGSVAGGTLASVSGSGFAPGSLLFFDGVPLAATALSSKTLQAATVAHGPGLVDVAVTPPDGWTATLKDAYNFVVEQPFIAAVEPDLSLPAGGIKATLAGQSFHPKVKVWIGETPAPVKWLDPGHVEVTIPPGDVGQVDIKVENPDGLQDVLEKGFLYTNELPGTEIGLSGLSPNVGPMTGGTPIVLQGKNLAADAAVIFGAAVGTDTSLLDAGTMLVTTPAVAGPGPVDVQVVSAGKGTTTKPKGFFFYDPNGAWPWPVASGLFPSVGPVNGGTIAAIFVTPALPEAEVWVGATKAELLGTDGAGTLVVKMPKGAAGSTDVTVMHPDGKASTLSNAFTYYTPSAGQKPPVLSNVTPSGGSNVGGTAITVQGATLASKAMAFIGYKPLVQPKWIDAGEIKGKTPAGTVGLADAAVTNPDGLSAVLPAAFAFQSPKPNPETIFPAVGSVKGGIPVVISGLDFHPQATVTIGGFLAAGVTVHSPTVLTAKLPPSAVTGAVDVTVENPGALTGTLAAGFTYTDKSFVDPPPAVLALVPKQGPFAGGTVLAIYGTGFQVGAAVLFGAKPAKVHRVESGFAVVTTPSGFVGPTDVTLLNPDGQASTLGGGFTYLTPKDKSPKLYGVTPASGPEAGGTPVILTGDYITGGGLGFVGYRPLSSWTVLNSSIATGTTGTLDPGTHDVVATNGDGQSATLVKAWQSVGAPFVDSFQPPVGPVAGGTLVTIAGKNFATGLKLTFGGNAASSVQVLSPFVVKAMTPPGTAGPAAVKIVNPDGQATIAAAPFEYLLPPELTGLFPSKGPATGGTPVILTGLALLPSSEVTFDGVAASSVSWYDDTTLVVTAPAGTAGKAADVLVTNPDGQSAVLYKAFTWIDPANLGPAPTLSALKPPTGPTKGGTWGLAQGEGFSEGCVLLLGKAPALTDAYSATTARFVSAQVSKTGDVDATMISPDGQWSTIEGGFAYTDIDTLGDAPVVTEVDPASGPTKGGTKVTLVGVGLDDAALVFFDLRPALSVAPVASGLEAVAPVHAAGKVGMAVTNEDGQTLLIADAFQFIPPPMISGIVPNAGPAAGGTFVTISGASFLKTPTVLFCAEYATNDDCSLGDSVLFLDSNTITAVTPAHTADLVEVVVVNPDGQAAVLGGGFFFRPPPKVYAIIPPTGSTLGGTKVTLEGTAFQTGATVQIGSSAALDVTVVDAETITLTTPPGIAGPVTVVVKNPDGATHTLGGGFTYVPPPIISNVFPNIGPEPGGTVVTIQGTGFVPGKSVVMFGQQTIDIGKTQVVSNILIQVESPPGVGPVAVRVTNPDGQFAVLAGGFTYVPLVPAPEVKSVTPPYGPTGGGFLVKVVGNGFLDGAQVDFGNSGVWATGYQTNVKNNGTLIVVTAPAHPKGKVDVRVTNTDGQNDALEQSFEYTEPQGLPGLAFAGIDPKRGPTKGGYQTTVYGQGFKQGVKVFFGDSKTSAWTEADAVMRLGPTILRVTMPTMPKGPADIRISNPAIGGVADEVVGTKSFTFGQGVILTPKGHLLPMDVTIDDRQPVIVDVNGDDLKDVMVFHNSQRPDLYINTKDPVTGAPGVFVDQSTTLVPGNYTSYWDLWHPRALDADKDGDMDVLVWRAYYQYQMVLFKNGGDGSFKAVDASPGGYDDVNDVTIGDFNCDGIDDLFLSRGKTVKDVILVGNGSGYWSPPPVDPLPGLLEPTRAAAAADVDHDGDLDLVLANDVATQDRIYYNNCNNINLPPECAFDIPGCAMYTNGSTRYAACPDSKSWDSARLRCEAFGMNLSTVEDTDELTFLGTKVGDSSWLGITDVEKEGTWVWPFGNSTMTSWCSNQPAGGTSYNCAYINKNATCMNAYPCGNGLRYVCESTLPKCDTPWQFTDGTYGPGKTFPNTGFDTVDVLLFDIDNDGWEDVFMANNGQSNRIYMNANGSFLADDGKRFPQEETLMGTVWCDAADIDGDGDTDIVLSKTISGATVWPEIYVNDKAQGGLGTFVNASLTSMPYRRTEDTRYFALGDLNADSLPDIFATNLNKQDWLFLNHGYNEDVPAIEQNRVPIGAFANNTIIGYPEDGWETYSVALGDIDGDGDLDAVMGTGAGQLTRLWVNDGQGNFFDLTGSRLPVLKGSTRAIMFLDLNGDGDLDIVQGDYNEGSEPGAIRLLANDGEGYFTDVTSSNFSATNTGSGWQGVTACDIDQDGDPDLVATQTDYSQSWMLTLFTNGGDAFQKDAAYFFVKTSYAPLPVNTYVSGKSVFCGDMNGDEWPDVYLGLEGQQNRLFFNDGTGKLVDKTFSHLSAVADSTRDVDVLDLDKDGDLDIFVTNNGDSRLHLSELNYKLGDVTASNLPIGMAFNSTGSVVVDLDGDTYPDSFIVNYGQQNNVLLNAGAAFFDDFSDMLPRDTDYSRAVEAGDLDLDGDLDLIIVGGGCDRIYLNDTPQ